MEQETKSEEMKSVRLYNRPAKAMKTHGGVAQRRVKRTQNGENVAEKRSVGNVKKPRIGTRTTESGAAKAVSSEKTGDRGVRANRKTNGVMGNRRTQGDKAGKAIRAGGEGTAMTATFVPVYDGGRGALAAEKRSAEKIAQNASTLNALPRENAAKPIAVKVLRSFI